MHWAMFAHLCVHIRDEAFGKGHRVAHRILIALFETENGESSNAGQDGESPIQRIVNPAFPVPGGTTRFRDDGVVKRSGIRCLGTQYSHQRAHLNSPLCGSGLRPQRRSAY